MFEWLRPEPPRPVLDTAYLERLAGHLGKSVLDELMADGLIELADRTRRLQEMAEAGDIEGLARLGHDLVGMAGHLGLSRLSAAAADLSRSAHEGRPDTVGKAEGVQRWAEEASEALRSYLGL